MNGIWGTTKDSFVFNFKNNGRIEDYVLSRVKDENKAIYNNLSYGPSFGEDDLYVWSENNYNTYFCKCKKASYEKPIKETGKFFIEECEVFQVINV